jgi:hypothetical protein
MAKGVQYMNRKVQSVSELASRVANDPALQQAIAADPAAALADIAEPLRNDVWIYRMVVGALGLTVLLAVVGATALAVSGNPTPDILTALGSAAVGALAGLLAPSPSS